MIRISREHHSADENSGRQYRFHNAEQFSTSVIAFKTPVVKQT